MRLKSLLEASGCELKLDASSCEQILTIKCVFKLARLKRKQIKAKKNMGSKKTQKKNLVSNIQNGVRVIVRVLRRVRGSVRARATQSTVRILGRGGIIAARIRGQVNGA